MDQLYFKNKLVEKEIRSVAIRDWGWGWGEEELDEGSPNFQGKRIKYLGTDHLRRQKNYIQKTIRHWWKKSKMT